MGFMQNMQYMVGSQGPGPTALGQMHGDLSIVRQEREGGCGPPWLWEQAAIGLIRALLSVIDFQALNFYQHELTLSTGTGKVPGISCLLGWLSGVQGALLPLPRSMRILEHPPGREKEGQVPGEGTGQDVESSGASCSPQH